MKSPLRNPILSEIAPAGIGSRYSDDMNMEVIATAAASSNPTRLVR